MSTFAIVLVLEDLAPSDGDPMDWNWSEMLDLPTSGYVAGTTEIASQPSVKQINILGNSTDIFIKTLKDHCQD